MKLRKLMWSIGIYTAATLPMPTQASSWLNCEVLAKVEEVRAGSDSNGTRLYEAKIRLLRNPYSCEGHGITRKHSNGQALWVGIPPEGGSTEIAAGMELKLMHKVYQGMGPDGPVKAEEWSVVEIVK